MVEHEEKRKNSQNEKMLNRMIYDEQMGVRTAMRWERKLKTFKSFLPSF